MAIISTSALAEAGGADGLRPALVEVTLNGQQGDEPVLLLEAPDGGLYAPAPAFAQWRLRLPPGQPVRYEGQLYYRISGLPAVRVRFAAETQTVAIDVSPAAFETQRASFDAFADEPMTRPSTGAFLNYDVLVEHVRGETTASGTAEIGVFTPRGVGVAGFLASAGSGRTRVVRLDTSWSIDRPRNATTIRIGDSVSAAGPGAAPVRFAGVQYFRNYAVRPGFVTMPLPAAAGDATVPSVVDVYVNNILQGSRDVAPGPFELANIPVPSGGGTVQLVVRDLLGREVVSEQAYYASNRLLRRGLHDFSYEAGFLRRGFGRRSNDYGEFMASTTHRYGFSDRLTGEAHLQASKSRQMAGAALTWAAFDLGQVGGSVSVSHSERGMGYRFAGSFERRVPGLSFGILSEYTSSDYRAIGIPDNHRPPRLTVQAFADLPIRRGSIGVNLLHRSLRGEADETLAGVFASYQVTGRAFVHLYARHAVGRSNETVFGAHLSLALGGRRTAFASVEHGRGGPSGHVSLQQNPPAGTGNGYRLEASLGEVDRVEAAFVRQLPMATVGVQAAHVNGSTGLRASATGSVGLVGGRIFASRNLGDSFAAVRLDGYPGVRVYADDQLVGVTDRRGRLVVPGLRAFEPNRLRIDETDLPLDARVEATELVVRPFARTGSVVAFPVRPERGVVVQLRREDGSAVPAGARLTVEGMDGDYVVASGGEAYVPDMTGRRLLTASWAAGRCSVVAEVPDDDDPQPRLDGLICREEARYAAH